jgi:hypothetical protein
MEKNLMEALNKIQVLKEKQKQQRKELNEAKKATAVEYAGQFTPEQSAEIIADYEKIKNSVKEKFFVLRNEFKAKVKELKQELNTAKGRVEILAYTMDNGLKKAINQIIVDNNIITIKREGINDITCDTKNKDWQKIASLKLAEALKVDITSGIVRSLVYKASLLVKSNN